MKVLYLIMGARNDLASRNIKSIFSNLFVPFQETYKGNNEFLFMFYDGGYDKEDIVDGNHIMTESNDDINGTFEKTIEALRMIDERNIHYDWLIRTNISQIINLPLFDEVLPTLESDKVYSQKNNVVVTEGKWKNNLYSRGDMFIMSWTTVHDILSVSQNFFGKPTEGLDHVDDVLLGMCLALTDKKYFKRLRILRYVYCPFSYDETKTFFGHDPGSDLTRTLGVRLKTSPPQTLSGWSWDDNVWRQEDTKKIEYCSKYLLKIWSDDKPKRTIEDLYEEKDKIAPLEWTDKKGNKQALNVREICRRLEFGF